MGLLDTEVEINLNGRNLDYLEKLGYEIPRSEDRWGRLRVPMGSKIIVKIEDLKPNSQTPVRIKCDDCGRENEVSYQSYRQNNYNGLCYCHKCVNKGDRSPVWNPNKTKEEREETRKYKEYNDFVKSVLARDDYTCHCCV